MVKTVLRSLSPVLSVPPVLKFLMNGRTAPSTSMSL